MTLYNIFNNYCSNLAIQDSEFTYIIKIIDKLLEIMANAEFTDEKLFYDTIYQLEQWKENYQHLFE